MSTDPPPPQAPPPAAAPAYVPHDARPQSRLAVAASVLGLLAFILPAVICAIIALRRIKRRNQRGRGFAIAGLALSAFWALAIAAILVFAFSTDAERDPSGRIVDGGTLDVLDVRDGDCLNGVEEQKATLTVDAVPCTEPHDAQAYAIVRLSGSEFPGAEEVAAQADRQCGDRFPGQAAREDEVFSYQPSQESWDTRNDRVITCVVLFKTRRTGSLEAG